MTFQEARTQTSAETAIEAAYKAAGGNRARATLQALISTARAKSTPELGARSLWMALKEDRVAATELMWLVLQGFERLLEEGHPGVAGNGQIMSADVGQSAPREDQLILASDGQPLPVPRGASNSKIVHVDEHGRKMPGRTKHGAAALARLNETFKRGILWKHKTTDGIPWAQVQHHELKKRSRDGGIAKAFLEYVPTSADPHAPLADLIPNDVAKKILETAHAA